MYHNIVFGVVYLYFSATDFSFTDYFCLLPAFKAVLMGPRLKTNFHIVIRSVVQHQFG